MYNIIYIHESLIGTIKSGFRKWLNNTIPPEAWLVMVYCNMGGQDRFVIITQGGMALR